MIETSFKLQRLTIKEEPSSVMPTILTAFSQQRPEDAPNGGIKGDVVDSEGGRASERAKEEEEEEEEEEEQAPLLHAQQQLQPPPKVKGSLGCKNNAKHHHLFEITL